MKKIISVAVLLLGCTSAFAQTALFDSSIEHKPKDGVIKIYGAGGPHTALRKVADLWEKQSATKVELIAGPESR
ncbi:hypothetical protein ACFPZK_06295 [Psychrobacter urativorans]|nr:hypothetical protein [Psychrobacter urativorans]